LRDLIESLIELIMQNAGAEKGVLILVEKNELWVRAEFRENRIKFLRKKMSKYEAIPKLFLADVKKEKKEIVLGDASDERSLYFEDKYIQKNKPKSVLGLPILRQGGLKGIVYLENNLSNNSFSKGNFELLQILVAQAAISLENSLLYEEVQKLNKKLGVKVDEQFIEIQEKSAENEELNNFLQKVAKQSTYATMASHISHEIKNPLTATMMGLESLYTMPRKEQDKRYIKVIKDSMSNLWSFLNNLENYTEISSKIKERISIKEILKEVFFFAKGDLEKRGIKLIKEIEDLPEILGDRNKLKQAFLDMILNILPTIDSKSELFFGAYKFDFIDIDEKAKQGIKIIISNAGRKSSPVVNNKIMESFFTMQDNVEGFGLSTALKIINEHNGLLEVNANQLKEVAFTVIFSV
jgi:nitrogen-specific signal transduction histidine kinase